MAIVAILYFFRGGYESKIDKTGGLEIVDSVDTLGRITPAMDLLLGDYNVNSQTGKAEILFDVDGLKSTQGAYTKFVISLNVPDDYTKSELNVSIEASSIDTENEMRDEHLREADFFDVKKFPKITFRSREFVFNDSNYTCYGDIGFIGLEKELNFDFRFLGGKDFDNKRIEVFEGTFIFDRINYGMEESSGIGNEVNVSFYVELEKVP